MTGVNRDTMYNDIIKSAEVKMLYYMQVCTLQVFSDADICT